MDLPFQVVEQTPAQSSQQTTLWKVLQQDENGDSLGLGQEIEDQKRRVSYEASFKRQVILYAEEHGNRKAAKEFGVAESNIRLWRQQRIAIFACKAARKKFTGPRKGRHPEVDEEVLKFILERRKNGLRVTSDTIRSKANEVATAQGIPRQVFKASRGWVDRFLKRMNISLRRRKTRCQKLPTEFEEELQSFEQYVIELQRGQIS